MLFGICELRDEQRPAEERLCGGKSVLAVMLTGGGKSWVYQMLAA